MPNPTQPQPIGCDYQSPLSRLQFVIHLPELHAMISFWITIFVSFFLFTLPSFGWFSAAIALLIGLTLSRHMARGGRSSLVEALIQNPLLENNPNAQKVAIITGSSSGLGLASAQLCLQMGIYVIFAVRDVEKCAKVIKASFPAISDTKFSILHLDLDNLDTVPRFVDEFIRLNKYNCRLDYLLNNAGAMTTFHKPVKNISPVLATKLNDGTYNFQPINTSVLPITNTNDPTKANQSSANTNPTQPISPPLPSQSPTPQPTNPNDQIVTSVDSSFTTNHLGHFLLTLLLLPYIIKSSTRVVTTSSAVHISVSNSQSVLTSLMNDEKQWNAPNAYANTKICNLWFTQALQRRLDRISLPHTQHLASLAPSNDHNNQVTNFITTPSTFAVHPGTIWSPFHMPYYLQTAGGLLVWFPILMGPMSYFCMKSTREGALTALHCCLGRSPTVPISDQDFPASIGPQPGQYHADCRVVAMSPVGADVQKQEELWQLSLLLCRKWVNSGNYPLFSHIL